MDKQITKIYKSIYMKKQQKLKTKTKNTNDTIFRTHIIRLLSVHRYVSEKSTLCNRATAC